MFAVDANILVYAVNSASPRHAEARRKLRTWLEEGRPFCLTWSVVYEFLKVATHPRVIERPLTFSKALDFLEHLWRPGIVRILTATSDHADLLREASTAVPHVNGSRFHDLHTALLMKEHGIVEIKTSDVDFHRFPWIRPTDPFQDEGG